MIPSDLVDLSRLQFALTAMYHFIFVPLTLGLSFMLVVMELAYVISGKQMYKDRPGSGASFLASTSPSVWLLASRWNFSSARIGPTTPTMWVTFLALHSPLKA